MFLPLNGLAGLVTYARIAAAVCGCALLLPLCVCVSAFVNDGLLFVCLFVCAGVCTPV
jgi:hypothetical protein